MPTNPLEGNGVPYSINTFTGNGTQENWEINLAGGYIRQSHVKAFTTSPAGVYTEQVITWVGANTVKITPAVPSGHTLTIWRDTPKDAPVVDFIDGAIVNEANLDALAAQATFAAAEMVDRFYIINDKATLSLSTSIEALAKANQAIINAGEITGGDFTKFARLDTAGTFTLAMAFSQGATLGTSVFNAAGQLSKAGGSYGSVYTTIDFTIADYATVASVTSLIATAKGEAIATAAADATSKANTAQSNAVATATATAAADATAKDAALLALIDPDWLYTLAVR